MTRTRWWNSPRLLCCSPLSPPSLGNLSWFLPKAVCLDTTLDLHDAAWQMHHLELWSVLDSPTGNPSALPVQWIIVIGTMSPGSSSAEPQPLTCISFALLGFPRFCCCLFLASRAQDGCGQSGFLPHLFCLISSFSLHESFPQISKETSKHTAYSRLNLSYAYRIEEEYQLPELSCKLIILQRSFRQSQGASNYWFYTLYNFPAKCNHSPPVSHCHLSLRTTWEQ